MDNDQLQAERERIIRAAAERAHASIERQWVKVVACSESLRIALENLPRNADVEILETAISDLIQEYDNLLMRSISYPQAFAEFTYELTQGPGKQP